MGPGYALPPKLSHNRNQSGSCVKFFTVNQLYSKIGRAPRMPPLTFFPQKIVPGFLTLNRTSYEAMGATLRRLGQ